MEPLRTSSVVTRMPGGRRAQNHAAAYHSGTVRAQLDLVPSSRDTTPEAEAIQDELYRKMGPARRTAIAVQMSLNARATTMAGIRTRHPEYDEATARWALFRLLVGDDLFKRAWPAAPLVAP